MDSKSRNRKGKTLHEHYSELSSRMTDEVLGNLRVATAVSWRGANGYFPAYRYHAGEFINDEWLACVDWHKPFHRDHVSHQVMCYWVAKRLLNCDEFGESLRTRCILQVLKAPECQYLRDYAENLGVFRNIPSELHPYLWDALFEETVFLATMYHDIGYPWQFVQSIGAQLNDNSPINVFPMQLGTRELYEGYGSRLLFYPFRGYAAPSVNEPIAWRKNIQKLLAESQARTHGFPGALAFLHLNDILRQFPDTRDGSAAGLFCIEWAAMAILMHDLQKIYRGSSRDGQPPENPFLRVCFRRDPLSFLLTLVDQIEDFCRPNTRFTKQSHDVRIRYRHSCHAVHVSGFTSGQLRITYFFGEMREMIENRIKYKPEVERDYFHPMFGYVDWSGLPIDSITLKVDYEPSPAA